jgi:multidrug efflux pump
MAFGILSFGDLAVREFPDIDFPIVSVSTNYPGASAAVVETRITQVVEDRISGIEGIKSITSSSEDGSSQVVVEFITKRDIDAAANDVRERISRIGRFLPEEADPPEIFKVNSRERPIMWFSLSSNYLSSLQLVDYAERNIVDRISVLEGVARVQVGGSQKASMRIWLDRQKLAARQLTTEDVERALRAENVELPAGNLESTVRDFTVRMERIYNNPDDFAKLVLAEGTDGHLIRLGEVARIEIAPVEIRREFRGNGTPRIGIGVVKQSTANTLQVAEQAIAEVERIKQTLPDSMSISKTWDSSVFVAQAIKEVYRTLFISVGLVILVIYLFLGSVRAALVPAVTVPVCLVSTFLILNTAGYSINMLTLLALVLSIGLVVDDAIVVLENIYRRVENGEPALLAAYRGARQVAFAVIATTMVLVGVFVPIVFLEGNVGRLFGELALTLAGAVVISSFVALTLSPMMCSKFLSRKAKKSWLTLRMEALFDRISSFYVAALPICFRNKSAIFLALAGALAMIFGLLERLPREFIPTEDRGGFFINFRGPEGTSFEQTKADVKIAEEKLLRGVADGKVQTLLIVIPGFGRTGQDFNNAFGIVILPRWENREISTDEVLTWARQELSTITGSSVFIGRFSGLNVGGGGPAVQLSIGANTYEELAGFREVLFDRLRENPILLNIDADYRETKPQLRIAIDRDRAADLGVSVEAIGRTLETMLGGRRVTTFMDRGEEYDVILRAALEDRSAANDVNNIYVRSSRSNELAPLASLVRMVEVADAGTLNRYNRVRALTISADIADGATLGEALDFVEGVARAELPNAISFDYKGESREFREVGTAVIFTFLLALLVVFLILAAQFESFIHPFIIMLTVPLAVAGGLAGLYLAGYSFNIYSQVGMIILIGLAAKNGILIVEFANQLRDLGYDVEEAVIEASRIRLRPIIMTGLSTAMGALPLILAMGAGQVSRASIGTIIFSGVIFATFFTLFVIPVFYRMLAGYTTSPGYIAHRLSKYEREFVIKSKGKSPAE